MSGIVLFRPQALHSDRSAGASPGINQLQAPSREFRQYRNSLPDAAVQRSCLVDSSDDISLDSDEYPNAYRHFSHRTFSKYTTCPHLSQVNRFIGPLFRRIAAADPAEFASLQSDAVFTLRIGVLLNHLANQSVELLVAATKRLQHPRRITPSNQHRLAVPRDQRRKIIWIVHDLSTQYAARTSASVEKRSGACNAGKRHNKGLA